MLFCRTKKYFFNKAFLTLNLCLLISSCLVLVKVARDINAKEKQFISTIDLIVGLHDTFTTDFNGHRIAFVQRQCGSRLNYACINELALVFGVKLVQGTCISF